jgi:hypothetical protein
MSQDATLHRNDAGASTNSWTSAAKAEGGEKEG